MIKQASKIILIFVLCTKFCAAQISETPTFLWMVLSKENKTPSFIYGTVHHLGPKLILDNKQLMSFILQSKLIVQEADTSELLHPTDTHFDFTSETALDELLYYLRDMKFSSGKEDMKPCFEKQDLNCLCKIDDMSHYTRPGDSTVIIKRNLFWIKKIENYIKQGNIFIAVGAAHLCGNSGIIALLKKRGYVIVPILTK